MPLSLKRILVLTVLSVAFLGLSPFLSGRDAAAEPKSLYMQAMEELDAGNTAKALELFNRLEKTDKKRALIGKLDLYKRAGNNEMVIQTVDELMPLVPGSKRLRLEKAIALRNLGGWEKAESLLQGIEGEIEYDPKLVVEYGRYLLFKGDIEGAEKVFRRALELDPNSDKAKLGLAYCHVWREQDAEAQALVTEVLTKNPNSLDALILQGWILAWNEKYEEAIAVFEKANGLRPNHPEVTRGLAQTYSWDGQYGRSIGYYQAVLALQPDNPDVLLELGRVYQKDGKYSEAVAVLENAARVDPDRTDIQEELKLARKWTSEIDDAVKGLRKKIALNRGEIEDYLSLGQAYRWSGQVKQSEKVYKAALKQDPTNVPLLYGYAQILEDKNDLEGARDTYKKILELKPNFMDAAVALKRIRLAFRPALMAQYNFIRSDLDSVESLITEHRATLEYGQRLHSLYTIRTGYTFNPIDDRNQATGTDNLGLFHHQFYLQNELNLPYDFTAVLRYDFHQYRNHGSNDFDLNRQHTQHGGYMLVSKPLPYNNLAFEFSRNFFQYVAADGAAIGREHVLTLSDDLAFGPYVSAQIAFSTDHNTATDAWQRTYTAHPRLVLPFFTPATVEYEGLFIENPNRQEHAGVVKLVGQVAGVLQVEGKYSLRYFTLTNDLGHNGQVFLSWAPLERLSFTLIGEVDFHAGDVIQNYLLSFNTFL